MTSLVQLMICLVFAVLVSGESPAANNLQTNNKCNFSVYNQSKRFYESRLIAMKPNFIHFMLQLAPRGLYNSTPDVFKPLHWVWTYKSPTASYPYLNWNIDHGLLSFGLLDVKTAYIPYVKMHVPANCSVTFGSNETTEDIVHAFMDLIINMSDKSYHEYEESYFCYLSIDASVEKSLAYTAAIYFNYPVRFINYKCCSLWYSYVNNTYLTNCTNNYVEKWTQCTLGPYVLGLVIFMYFPLVLLQICAWLSKGDDVERHEFELANQARGGYEPLNSKTDYSEWIFLDGNPPITLLEKLSFFFCGLGKNHPVSASRIRRMIGLFLAPSVIFIKVGMYANGIGKDEFTITVPELVSHGTPMGFLSLLADRKDRLKYFAPILGGPVCVLIMYYILGVAFVVLPRSLKQIVERGMPGNNLASPLCLRANEIITLSMMHITPEPGYENGVAVCQCGIYMIFNRMFWLRAFEIQRARYRLNYTYQTRFMFWLKLSILPIYILLCIIELLCCVIFYGIPAFGFTTMMVKGAAKSFFMFRLHNTYVSTIFRNVFTVCVGTIVVLISFLFFFYSICLIFVESFSFISQIVIFCFVSVIVYPSVSFGYLFFFIVLCYYIVRLFKDFGDGYLELLSTAVEKSQDMYLSHMNYCSVFGAELSVSTVQAKDIRTIRINNQVLDIPQNILQRMDSGSPKRKIIEHGNLFAIPKRLFELLVRVHRPVHIQVLRILLQFSFVVLLVVTTLSITSKFVTGATSEISEVMHVMFIVTVGAVPHILEVALMNGNEKVKREIEIRHIEKTIKEFWLLDGNDGFTFES